MFCWIPKNSCTKFKQLFSRVGGVAQWRSTSAVHRSPNLTKAHFLNTSDVEQLLADPRSLRAVLLRDPVERFLSAYAEKIATHRECHRLSRSKSTPCNYGLAAADVARFMRDFPRWLEFDHMSPQVNFCGFKHPMVDYKRVWNRIGYYNRTTIASVSGRLFDGRLDEPMQRGWGGAAERGMWGWAAKRGMWDDFSPHALGADRLTMFKRSLCTNRTVLEALQLAYAEDYEFFKLPVLDLCLGLL